MVSHFSGVDPRSSQKTRGRSLGVGQGCVGGKACLGSWEILGLGGGQDGEQRRREGQAGAGVVGAEAFLLGQFRRLHHLHS